MYKIASRNQHNAAGEASRKAANAATRKRRAAAEKTAAENATKKLALQLNAQQDAKNAAMMAAYHARKGRQPTA